MFDAMGRGVNVSVGMAVNASDVEVGGAGVPVEIKVGAAGTGKVGVGGAESAGAQLVSSTNPITTIERVLMFICLPLLTIISPVI